MSVAVPSAPSVDPITPGSAEGRSTTAPAPSPKRMQVLRSVMSRTLDNTSAPSTSTVSADPDSTNATPVESPYEKPAQAAFTSNAGHDRPSLR